MYKELLVKYGLIVLGLLAILNIVALDIVTMLSGMQQKTLATIIQQIVSPSPSAQTSQVVSPLQGTNSCPVDCLSQIYQATTGATKTLPQSPTSAPTLAATPASATSSNGVKDYFIPMGSGQSSDTAWTNVYGLQAYVDASQYPQIAQVVFEASLHIPTGNETASVRLFDVTTQHPVWYSDVSITGGTPELVISSPITLDSGNSLYQVQMMTSLGYQAVLDQARIHITLH